MRKDARGSCLPKFDLHNILLERVTNSALRTTEGHRHDIEAGEESSNCCSYTRLPFLTWLAQTTFCDNTRRLHSIGVSNRRKHSPRPKRGIISSLVRTRSHCHSYRILRDLEEVLSRVFGDAHVFDDPLDGEAVGPVELAEELSDDVLGDRRPQLPRPSWAGSGARFSMDH